MIDIHNTTGFFYFFYFSLLFSTFSTFSTTPLLRGQDLKKEPYTSEPPPNKKGTARVGVPLHMVCHKEQD